jgi:hypothetical protein
MKLFIYYNKSDLTQEPYGKLEAINLEDATLIASHIKQMSKEDFLNIFEIKEYERRKIQKSK